MPDPLADRLRERIERDGPLLFPEWMEACLYDRAEGFYSGADHPTGTGPGTQYATAASLHPFFAQAVAREAASTWRSLGSPKEFAVVEYGAGRLDLAREALAWLDRVEPGLAGCIQWHVVERAPLPDRLPPRLSAGAPPKFRGLAIAVEFLDALPFHWLEWRDGAWREVAVGWDGHAFCERHVATSSEAVAAAPDGSFVDGQRVACMAQARAWLEDVASRLAAGSVLVVDYGDRGERLWVPERPDGTVRSFRGHAAGESVLDHPGRQDLTASVDFSLTRSWGEEAGLRESCFETQEAFLLRHGVLEELNRIPRDSREGASSYLRLRQLLLPTGMGTAFHVQRFDRVRPGPDGEGRTPRMRTPP